MIIAVVAIKGGVGKTTTTFCLAATLTRLGKKVLCIDLDPQGDLSVSLGCDRGSSNPSIGEVLNAPRREQEKLIRTSILEIEGWTNLITPGDRLDYFEKELAKGIGPDLRLRDALSTIQQEYDFILIDTPKGNGLLTTNAMVSCEEVLVPVQMEWLALNNLPMLLQQVSEIADRLNPNLVLSTLVPSQLKRTSLSNQIYQSISNWNANDFLPHQEQKVWVSPPVHQLTLYAELSEKAVPIYEHPGVQKKHLEPFETIAKQLAKQNKKRREAARV
ncbi:ParA family protein [Leptolyngbya ohadii]|uniref:ParA family protein n=1 Tax=Leptolyngbya ohadii TaxID=1962290 RepID=UPI000B59A1F9|nr:AAA family ATPase [Leptolyngbya ohadii]